MCQREREEIERERAIMAVGSVVQDYDRLVCVREREKRAIMAVGSVVQDYDRLVCVREREER